jgi:hypothetical protein
MKRIFLFLLAGWMTCAVNAQQGQSSFDYLLLPSSARASALGGTNVSVVENDASLIYDNPAFLGYEMDKTLQASYLSYLADIGMGNVLFTKKANERTSWGVGMQYAHYGQMLETTDDDQILGDLKASDMCANVFVARDITDRLRGGIAGKFFYSNYTHNTAYGLGVDLGLSYYNEDAGFSWGLVGKNIGRQIKAYEEDIASLPWDIQFGLTKRLGHSPLRFSVTAVNLKKWKFDDIYSSGDKFGKTFFKHLIIGGDILFSDNFYVSVGYNIKRHADMHLADGNKFGGFSIGAGLSVKRFNVSCAMGKYNTSASSFLVSISTSLSENSL